MQMLVLTVGTQGIELFCMQFSGLSAEWKRVLSTIYQTEEPLRLRPYLSHNQALPEDEFQMGKQISTKLKCCPVHSCAFVILSMSHFSCAIFALTLKSFLPHAFAGKL